MAQILLFNWVFGNEEMLALAGKGVAAMNTHSNLDLIDVYDQLLSLSEQMSGKRSGLYISSSTDLECCIVMLCGEGSVSEEDFERNETRQYPVYQVNTAH